MLDINKIYLGNCLELLKNIESNSIDMIISDLPFAMTENNCRVIKDNGVIALMSAGIFTAKLIIGNKKYYRYSCIWKTKEKTNFLNANK